jgi:Zn-dependent protease
MMIQLLATNPLSYLRIIVILILSICIHELAHGIVALSQGDDTPRRAGHMTLNPIIHMGWDSIFFLCLCGISWGAMPVNPNNFRSRQWGDFLVSAAGPCSNLILGIICISVLRVAEDFQFLSKDFFFLAALVNINLFLFNCLPIPPLDGFHMFSKFFPGLKELGNTNFGSFALIIIMVSGVGRMLSVVSGFIISFSLALF